MTLIRWATVALGIALAALDSDEPRQLLAIGAPLVLYAAWRTVRPLRYLTRGIESFVQVLFEVGLTLAVVVSTGYWTSPYVFTLATAILAAGFARGFAFALRTAGTAIAAVALPYHLAAADARLLVTVQWATELFLIGVIAGYARRLFGEAEEQTVLARQANDLLAQLHDIAQTLPSSLDLDETASDAIRDLRAVTGAAAGAVLLRDSSSDGWIVAATDGLRLAPTIADHQLPVAARHAVRDGRAMSSSDGPFFSAGASHATFLPLVARSRLVGLVALESGSPPAATDGAEVDQAVHRAALAIDNARWFTMIRRVGADEERTRIARDLHDRVGQSLAFVGFELDRIGRQAGGDAVDSDLRQLRDDVRKVVTEVRDTLYDLRTDVSEDQGIVPTLKGYLDRIGERTAVAVALDVDETLRLPLRQEREFWRIAQEAIANASRHAEATTLSVRWRCDGRGALLEVVDDGKGMPSDGAVRGDAYGVRGMRERAAAIGGRLTITGANGRGTRVRCEVST